ncbi:MAG: hypothetical protein K8U57_28615 [Planctomycetes bacterium]|nr:hypothetical protein [Planctomycetota bacterium]
MGGWKRKVPTGGKKVYLWGGAEIGHHLPTSIILTIRVDDFGENVRFGVRGKTGEESPPYGTLQPGECFTLDLKDLRGVWAECTERNVDTMIHCVFHNR